MASTRMRQATPGSRHGCGGAPTARWNGTHRSVPDGTVSHVLSALRPELGAYRTLVDVRAQLRDLVNLGLRGLGLRRLQALERASPRP